MRPDPDFIACGASLRIQSPQGSGDDTVMNGLELAYCFKENWDSQSKQVQHKGDLGQWTSMKMCSNGKNIYSMNARVEKWKVLGDDTSMNGLMIAC